MLAVFPTPDARTPSSLHDKPKERRAGTGAFSLVPIATGCRRRSSATARAAHLGRDRADERSRVRRRARRREARSSARTRRRCRQLTVDRYALASPPIAVGVVAGAKRAFVAQQHPEGRLTFIDLESGIARTLTGFELSSRVVDGSKPVKRLLLASACLAFVACGDRPPIWDEGPSAANQKTLVLGLESSVAVVDDARTARGPARAHKRIRSSTASLTDR